MEPKVFADPAPNPALVYTITELDQHHMDNIIVALQLLIDQLDKVSIQRIQCEELLHTLKGQRNLAMKRTRRR